MSGQEAKPLSKEEAEKKWLEYLQYLERCRQNKWIPAKPSKMILDALGKSVSEIEQLKKASS